MKCKPFCILEKDEKTYKHICEYYDAIVWETPLMAIDSIIQKRELENHLKRTKGTESKEEAQNWIQENAEPFRAYLNSLKLLTLFIFMDNKRNFRENVPYELFETYVEIWKKEKQLLIDTIRIND